MEEGRGRIKDRVLGENIQSIVEVKQDKTPCITIPSPIADEKTTIKVLDMLEQAKHFKQLKKGRMRL